MQTSQSQNRNRPTSLILVAARAPVLIALVWCVALAAASAPVRASDGAAPSGQQGISRIEIASPAVNSVVRGAIQITGTAVDPNFRQYELDWAPDPPVGDAWTPIQPPVAQQVQDGILGVWNTATVPDGLYLIRLRLIRTDELTLEREIRVQVVNATPTPRPTHTPLPSPTPLPGTATPGPSPTALIWQPPTRTPRPTAGPGTPTATLVGPDPAQSPFHPERLRQAACSGLWITLGAFLALGLYGATRFAVRRPLRVVGWRLANWLRNRNGFRRDR